MKYIRTIKRLIIDSIKTLNLYKNYNLSHLRHSHLKKTVIVMLDGKMIHGGLSDRFWGILSIYKYCREKNIDFKLNFCSPYNLETFLIPNAYNWRISQSEILYNLRESRPIYISMFYHDREKMKKYIERRLNSKSLQLHIYSNSRSFQDNQFHYLFNELFKPTPLVREAIELQLKKIGDNYISLTFRFQQLLGDFQEGKFPILSSESERKELIERCIKVINKLSDKQHKKILVTSDSTTFLKLASKLENVFTIPGKIVHVDYNAQNESLQVHLKSFIDLFMISNATEVYLANIKPLYHSGFPETAALIGNKPYFEIDS